MTSYEKLKNKYVALLKDNDRLVYEFENLAFNKSLDGMSRDELLAYLKDYIKRVERILYK